MKVDKKQLDFFIKNRKIEDKESELYIRILKNIDITINDFKSEQKKKQRLKKINDLEEKRKLLDVLNKDQIKTLPDWIIKEKLENCFVMGSTNKTILTPSGKKYHIDNKLNDLTGGEWSYFLRSVINTRYGTKGEDSFAHEIRKISQ